MQLGVTLWLSYLSVYGDRAKDELNGEGENVNEPSNRADPGIQ